VSNIVLQVVMQLGSLWLSVNVALVTYLALSYMFDRVYERMEMRARIPVAKRSGKLLVMGR
jgi:ABC-type uncharacterized transport system YnjBCD permease subunit